MPTVNLNPPLNFPNLLQLTTRVRRECTRETLVTLTDDPINNVIVDAVNDATEDIYYKNRWNWKKSLYNFRLIQGQADYALPADFYQLATEPEYNGVKMLEVDPEDWFRHTYDPSVNPSNMTQGSPAIYMVDRTFIRLHPVPSETSVSTAPFIPAVYYRRPPPRLSIADDTSNPPDLPPEFIEAVVAFGKWKLKVHLQFDDFELDERRYREIVQKQIENDYISVHPVRMRPRKWNSVNFG